MCKINHFKSEEIIEGMKNNFQKKRKSQYLLQECFLRLFITTDKLFHDHHLPCGLMGHLENNIHVQNQEQFNDCLFVCLFLIMDHLHSHFNVSGRITEKHEQTLMACPKKPFPRISPWMRSQGRKIRCEQLEGERRDSERPISRVRTRGSFGDTESGDLQLLLLRLQHRSTCPVKRIV